MRDASLDEFLGAGGDDEAETTGDGEEPTGTDGGTGQATDGGEAGTGGTDADPAGTASGLSVGPATVTHDWSPEGVVCETCGDRVETRWHDHAGLVCRACKEW
jgi:hypothetical protein